MRYMYGHNLVMNFPPELYWNERSFEWTLLIYLRGRVKSSTYLTHPLNDERKYLRHCLFEKGFAKFLFNTYRKKLTSDRFNKSFSFSIYSLLFKKVEKVLSFCIFVGSSSMWWHVFQRAANNFSILLLARIYPNNILHIWF